MTETEREDDGFRGSLRADLHRCRTARLHLLVPTVLTATLALGVVAFVVVSGAVGAPADLPSFVELLTTNSAWLFGSVFALVGLFVAYPARSTDGHASVTGTLVSRCILVALGVVLGSAVVLVVGVTAFESYGFVSFVVFALLTTATVCAYVSVGVTLAALTHTDGRLVLSLLSVYVFFVHLWDTALAPTLVAMAVVGDAGGVVGSPPPFYDTLLALSPYGAYSTLLNTVVGVGDGYVTVVVLALLFWFFVPPAFAVFFTD
ncbi:MAG: hypothetical protein U5J64_03585 [Halobacteriales archaeon]|nr:hypothetical protein [Halobacteriales archaeon]